MPISKLLEPLYWEAGTEPVSVEVSGSPSKYITSDVLGVYTAAKWYHCVFDSAILARAYIRLVAVGAIKK